MQPCEFAVVADIHLFDFRHHRAEFIQHCDGLITKAAFGFRVDAYGLKQGCLILRRLSFQVSNYATDEAADANEQMCATGLIPDRRQRHLDSQPVLSNHQQRKTSPQQKKNAADPRVNAFNTLGLGHNWGLLESSESETLFILF